jgi:putative DNA methylase
MLESLVQTGFMITGTWPIRTEMPNRSSGQGTNSLASSIVLICRPRQESTIATRRQFLTELRRELPAALKILQQHGDIAPVDLAQVCVGPGMAVYSRYSQVHEADGTPLRVRTALQLINSTLDEILSEQESEYDVGTRWAIAWFDQHGMEAGIYGDADVLSKAKNTSVEALKNMGWLESGMSKVRLRKYEELSTNWQPQQAQTLTVWETLQRMISALQKDGEESAASILRVTGAKGEMARDLAYRLHGICEGKGWSQEAQLYNGFVTSWGGMTRHAHDEASAFKQESLFAE